MDRDLSKKELFAFFKLMPWKHVSDFFQKTPHLKKRYCIGGFILSKTNHERAFAVMVTENKYLEYIYDMFIDWYRTKPQYSELLDPHFNSPEYADDIKDKEIDNGTYVINDNKFNELAAVLTSKDAKMFRSMSPIIFTHEQIASLKGIEFAADAEVKGVSDNDNLIKQLKKDLKKLKNEHNELHNDKSKLLKENEK